MKIDERVDSLVAGFVAVARCSPEVRAEFASSMRMTLLEVARDQRHACAEAVAALQAEGNAYAASGRMQSMAYQAVMNATIK